MVSIPDICAIDKVLGGSFGTSWKLLDHSTKFLTAPGENYGSTILALEVRYVEEDQEHTVHLVAKLCPPTELLKEAFLTSRTFKKETATYLSACPAIARFESEHRIPRSKRLDVFVKCFGARTALTGTNNNNNNVDNDAVIILENLKVKGFQVEDRMRGFDLDTSRQILKDLARFHATVVAMRRLNETDFNSAVLPSLESVNNGAVMVDGFIGVANTLAGGIDELKPHLERLKAMTDSRKQYCGLVFPCDSNKHFYTIVHTDFWLNNILIRRDDKGVALQSKIIDFQLTVYGSPVRDLLFFLYTSVRTDVCDLYTDELIRFYYRMFVECLDDYQCDLTEYGWDAFEEELNATAPHELYHIVFMLKPIFTEKGSIVQLADIDVADFGRTDNCGAVYIEKLKQVVLAFAAKGWL